MTLFFPNLMENDAIFSQMDRYNSQKGENKLLQLIISLGPLVICSFANIDLDTQNIVFEVRLKHLELEFHLQITELFAQFKLLAFQS